MLSLGSLLCLAENAGKLLHSEDDGPVAHCRALASFRDANLQSSASSPTEIMLRGITCLLPGVLNTNRLPSVLKAVSLRRVAVES